MTKITAEISFGDNEREEAILELFKNKAYELIMEINNNSLIIVEADRRYRFDYNTIDIGRHPNIKIKKIEQERLVTLYDKN